MRYGFAILVFLSVVVGAAGQDQPGIAEGKVSFVTTQSVYVRFDSFEGISEGDTLYLRQGTGYVPALVIRNTSSLSCVCTPILAREFRVSDVIYAKPKPEAVPETVREAAPADTLPRADKTRIDSVPDISEDRGKRKQEISGRISVSSHSDFFSRDETRLQRLRYTFAMRAKNLGGSGFSAETYLSFSHSNSNWEDVKENIFNGLKIYNLALKYDFNETMEICAGRRINPRLSSVGAIDGVQFSKRFGSLTVGALAGSRPDNRDYSFNPELVQIGIYAGYDVAVKWLRMQNTVGIFEQTNRFITDRRFLYFQHTSWLMKNLVLLGSVETDLYKKVRDSGESAFTFSNLYTSLRYRIIKQLSIAVSYSSRHNIIYYETYKDFLERLLDKEALQGWQARVNALPLKNLSIGISGGYRYRKNDPKPSLHLYGYATYRQVPLIHATLTLSATWLETSYLKGDILSMGLSRDLVPGKLRGGVKYRYVDYLYQLTEEDLVQNIFEADFSWLVRKKLSLSLFYEGSFDPEVTYNRIYINCTQRF